VAVWEEEALVYIRPRLISFGDAAALGR